MKDFSINRKEVTVAIAIWSLPWIIVALILSFYKDQVCIVQNSGFSGIIISLCFFYAFSSYCSFRGFILPIFLGKDLSALKIVRVPKMHGVISPLGKSLLKKYMKDIHNADLFSSVITVHDFLNTFSERVNLFSYLPSEEQMRKYPFESLELMLSAQYRFKELNEDKYFNFELVINCLKNG